MDASLQQRIDDAVREEISIVPYHFDWPAMFDAEAEFLRRTLPHELLGRIEHFGSTAIPGMPAKPIIDMLIEVAALEEARERIVPILTSCGYEYFWRTDVDVPYAWFIKRGPQGHRTHHLHLVEAHSSLWERLYFRDYLRLSPEEAKRYGQLKEALAHAYPHDRVAYTAGKSEYIIAVTAQAKQYFGVASP
jgi:GrpB-like predicted nucleotidyltransferase (UPF0157 family)